MNDIRFLEICIIFALAWVRKTNIQLWTTKTMPCALKSKTCHLRLGEEIELAEAEMQD
jgi:hypothetical protein